MRRVGLLVLVFLMAIGFSGCWDSAEIEEVAIVGSLAIDKGEEGMIVVSLEVINPGALASGTSGAIAESPIVSVMTRDEAYSIPAAISSAQQRTPRRICTGLVNTIVVGQALALEGIGEYIDCFVRNATVRSSAVMTTCDTGAGLLQRPFMFPLPSRTLAGLYSTAPLSGMTKAVTVSEFLAKLSEPGIEPISLHTVGRKTKDVEVKRHGEDIKHTDPAIVREQPTDVYTNLDAELPPGSPLLDPYKESSSGEFVTATTINIGIAAYRGDKLVGFLDDYEARGYLWTVGKVEGGAVEIDDPGGSGKKIALSVIRSSSSIKPVLEQGALRMEVEIHVDLETRQLPMGTVVDSGSFLDALENALNALILREARTTLNKVQKELKTDIYGFGNRVYRTNPKLWAELEPRWNEEVFPDLEVNFTVKSRIRAPGAAYGVSTR
ncbi:MAG TPA: Ger(x)C family spore germination protein [Firmicutes bacterium]|nr:Ger(x)C family spore germination protein [Candidatus Fermentithermobacillaceae bacterium]